MQVNGVNQYIYSEASNQNPHTRQSQTAGGFADIMASTQAGQNTHTIQTHSDYAMDTNQGHLDIDLDSYLNPTPRTGTINLGDIPLLLPTAHNIDTLSKYSEEKFHDLLEQYSIPEPPANIEFDSEGKLVLPADYPYARELKQALAVQPSVENALRTTAALASHYAGIMESAAFRDEMMTARNQMDQDRIIEKYSHLFDENRPDAQIVLSFLKDGSMLVGNKNA